MSFMGPRSRCQQGWLLLETPEHIPPFFQFLEAFGIPCLRTSSQQSLLPFTSDLLLHSLILSGPSRTIQENVPITRSDPSLQYTSVSDSLWPHELHYTRPPCPSPTAMSLPNSSPLSQWCHPSISSSVVPFSSCPQSFPASGCFQMSQFFTSGGQSIGISASTSVLPMNIQDWFHLGWTGWISLQFKELSRVFSNITFQKHQFFGSQLSL